MATEADVLRLTREFLGRISSINEPKPFAFKLGDLRGRGRGALWEDWQGKRGVYYFVRGATAEVVYVGMAAPGNLGDRVSDEMNQPREGEWGRIISDSVTGVGVLAFHDSDWYWPPSLELYLIHALQPEINVRGR